MGESTREYLSSDKLQKLSDTPCQIPLLKRAVLFSALTGIRWSDVNKLKWSEHEQDKNLHAEIIDKELLGVFNWVLQGLNRLLEQKRFSDCEAAQQAVEQYKFESNNVHLFLNENEYKSSPTNYKLITELYQEYKAFCIEDGMTPFKKTNFIKQLRALGFVVDRASQNKLVAFIEAHGLSF